MNEPFPLSQCKTMSSADFQFLKGDWIMEPKIDGWRMQIDVTPTEVQAWTRTAHSATGKMPVVEHHLKRLTAGHSFRLDGEAVFIDENDEPDYNMTARMLGSGVGTCVDKQSERGMPLTYFVFDILMLDGEDCRHLNLMQRKDLMEKFLSSTGAVELIQGDAPTYDQHIRNFEHYKEGSVLKDARSTYAGKRHKSWMKWKECESVDVTIIGYKRGQGKFKDLVGAIHFRAPDGTQGYCSGMDDATRVWITDHMEQLRGTVIEIKHFGKLVDGYRHPQFMRFRSDKL